MTSDEKRDLVARVAESDLFRRAPRQREFLLYVAGCTLDDRLDGVREQAIAEHVFNRTPEQYDGDTIVRAEARNLRKRLDKYFEDAGAEESFLIVMPKGGYSITFRARHSESTTRPDESETSLTQSDQSEVADEDFVPPLAPAPLTRTGRWRTWAIAALAVILLATAVALFRWQGVKAAPGPDPKRATALPFSYLFSPSRDTLIVTSDTAFLQIGWLAHRRLSLDDYLTRSYPNVPNLSPPDLIQNLNRFQYTDADEMGIAASIMREHPRQISRTYLRSGHQVALADFKTANIILLGSPISNPWAQLYRDRVNFQFDQKQGAILLRNAAPRSGESAVYPSPEDVGANRTYAHVVFIPDGLDGNRGVLLVAGTTAEATQAAGEFLLDYARLAATLRSIGVDPTGKPRYFELLLRATTFVGGTTEAQLVAYRS